MANATDPGTFESVLELMTTTTEEPADEPKAKAAPAQEQPADDIAEDDAEIVAETDEADEAEDVDAAPEPKAEKPKAPKPAQNDEIADEAQEERFYTVKVDGKSRDVTLDELLRGFSGQEYVQEGMETAARLKKEAQSAYNTLQDELAAIRDLRSRMERGDATVKPTPPSRDKFQSDPIGYMEEKLAYDEAMERYDADQSRLNELGRADNLRSQKAQQAHLQQQMQIVVNRIPELADPEKAPAYQQRLVAAARNFYGFSDQEARAIDDGRLILALNDAMKYRAMQDARAQGREQVAKPKPVIKPGTAKTEVSSEAKKRQQARDRMRKAGDMESVVNFLMT